ncbi:MAG: acylphosphatase [Ignavibacteria bacterium]|nr:acylphosphatase [Ignavibacteria bacterium]
MMKRAEYKVYGIVQGVGYRYFVYRIASSLNLKGYAKNLYDGSVLVVAEGEEEKLHELLRQLKVGPSHAFVQKVEVEYSEPKNEFSKFEIR